MLKKILRPIVRFVMACLPAKWHIIAIHLRTFGQIPNLKDPTTFNEKIARRKLYDRDSRLPDLVDKILVKEEMARRFGADFVIPTITTFQSEKDIDFKTLSYPCVVKANHGSGLNVFLMEMPKDRSSEGKIRSQLRRALRRDHSALFEEWAYSQVPRRLLVEPFIEGGKHGLVDYKFHTFNGRVFAIQVDVDRYSNHRRGFLDAHWNELPFELAYPRPEYIVERPSKLKDMLGYAEDIGSGFSYVRVDLYEVAGRVKFGELTFYPGGGWERFIPPQYDRVFGEQWLLGS